jgi:hypothetical protein
MVEDVVKFAHFVKDARSITNPTFPEGCTSFICSTKIKFILEVVIVKIKVLKWNKRK